MFLTLDEHLDYVEAQLDLQPTAINIATFGIYCGILHNGGDLAKLGGKFKSRTRTVLDRMIQQKCQVRILTGIANYKSCKDPQPCFDCEVAYAKTIFRYLEHTVAFPTVQWRANFNLHAKFTIFQQKQGLTGILGGRNFTDSNWEDVTVVANQQDLPKLVNHFISLWKTAKPLNESTVGEILDQFKISPDVVNEL